MSDENTPGSSFGVQPAALNVDPATLREPVVVEETAQVSRVPAEARAKLTDRLRKRKPIEVLVDLGDGDTVLVKGMDVYAVEKMNETDDGAPVNPDAPVKITERNPKMMRRMCYDPDTGESLFGTGIERQVGVDPDTDQPIIEVDGWTDHEINSMPINLVTALMQGINVVMGHTAEPGKGSPSTPDDASSSS